MLGNEQGECLAGEYCQGFCVLVWQHLLKALDTITGHWMDGTIIYYSVTFLMLPFNKNTFKFEF